YLVSKFLLNFHSSGINARMPIQSSQVRGGTLISLPFFSFFPSLCLSSAIIQNVRPKLTRPFPGRNTGFPRNHCHFNRRRVCLSSLKRSAIRRPSTQNKSPDAVVATTS